MSNIKTCKHHTCLIVKFHIMCILRLCEWESVGALNSLYKEKQNEEFKKEAKYARVYSLAQDFGSCFLIHIYCMFARTQKQVAARRCC